MQGTPLDLAVQRTIHAPDTAKGHLLEAAGLKGGGGDGGTAGGRQRTAQGDSCARNTGQGRGCRQLRTGWKVQRTWSTTDIEKCASPTSAPLPHQSAPCVGQDRSSVCLSELTSTHRQVGVAGPAAASTPDEHRAGGVLLAAVAARLASAWVAIEGKGLGTGCPQTHSAA